MADDLTVIVIAIAGGVAFSTCAKAARAQAARVILVSRDGKITDGAGKPMGVSEQCNIPFKRKSAARLASTPLVGLIEDTVIPAPGWADAVRQALADSATVACGGPVSIAAGLAASSTALAIAEYGAFNSRRRLRAADALPGCNFAFRRDALLEAMPANEGLVDQLVFTRLAERGGRLAWASGMAVTFCQANDDGARLATRFRHGRIYAGASAGQTVARRAAAAGKSLLLPAVLTLRNLRRAPNDRLSPSTLGWLILQSAAWSAGEFAGAVLGPPSDGMSQWQ